jgi:hypothetical protein
MVHSLGLHWAPSIHSIDAAVVTTHWSYCTFVHNIDAAVPHIDVPLVHTLLLQWFSPIDFIDLYMPHIDAALLHTLPLH